MLLPICLLEEVMVRELKTKTQTETQVTVEESNRLLEVGRLLFSVLTPDEIKEL